MANIGDMVRINAPKARKVHGLIGKVVFIENIGVVDHVVILENDPTETPRYFCPDELEVIEI